MSTKSDRAAKRFFSELLPREPWDYSGHKSKPLIVAAFNLYAEAWKPFNIEQWEWPFAQLENRDGPEHRKQFEGDEPWTLLLRRAFELSMEVDA